jgi:hypothetical protein
MYTVLRFSGSAEALDEIGRRANLAHPGIYQGHPDRGVPNRISCEIATSDDWALHCHEIEDSVIQLRPVVEYARQIGFDLMIDIAVDNNDYKSRWITSFPFDTQWLQFLCDHGLRLCLTIYGDGCDDVGANEKSPTDGVN